MGLYALIEDGEVVNVVVAEADFVANVFESFFACVDVTDLDPRPGPGWAYDGQVFTRGS